jgi:hypothetical protein
MQGVQGPNKQLQKGLARHLFEVQDNCTAQDAAPSWACAIAVLRIEKGVK